MPFEKVLKQYIPSYYKPSKRQERDPNFSYRVFAVLNLAVLRMIADTGQPVRDHRLALAHAKLSFEDLEILRQEEMRDRSIYTKKTTVH